MSASVSLLMGAGLMFAVAVIGGTLGTMLSASGI